MAARSATVKEAAYDVVGRYDQDSINGFPDDLIERMLEAIDPDGSHAILDAMAGDGNLSSRLSEFCEARSRALPTLCVLEFSRVQAEFARHAFSGSPRVRVLWGDVLEMRDLDTGEPIPDETFDRVMIKSANHEIPFRRQGELYGSISRVLKPGGVFVNLGFLFDDEEERNEFRSIAKVKDRLAGMESAVQNRHFLTRSELYPLLTDAGFSEVAPRASFDYRIRSHIVAEQYFSDGGTWERDLEHQIAQLSARKMRRNGRIRFEGDTSLMCCPGEITWARKATRAETNEKIFREYPYDFLRRIKVHSEMLGEARKVVDEGSEVLDLGCGIGLFAERLVGGVRRYAGVDLSSEFISICRERYGRTPGFSFEEADMNTINIERDAYDVVTILNALYLPGVEPLRVLGNCLAALRPGGRLVVAGPNSPESYRSAEPFILRQLEIDGALAGNEELMNEIGKANDRLLSQRGNYWSAEGMIALLRHVGFREIASVETGIYYGYSYMVTARK